jgi:hypothetical protein
MFAGVLGATLDEAGCDVLDEEGRFRDCCGEVEEGREEGREGGRELISGHMVRRRYPEREL